MNFPGHRNTNIESQLFILPSIVNYHRVSDNRQLNDDNDQLPVIEVDLEAIDNSSSYGQELSAYSTSLS
ncbi:hypothetical protein AFLA_006631 [Aspergillus flavus NRRL3357]|nr:hypothetical protein AFLA_006631 [Aspergillus flavus NRRL3357]